MNAITNKVELIGNLGRNPEIKTLESGKKIAKMNLATHETYKNAQGEKVTETQWHSLVAWGKLAEIVEKHIFKGHEIAVKGKLMNYNYITKDGKKRSGTQVQVTELMMLRSN